MTTKPAKLAADTIIPTAPATTNSQPRSITLIGTAINMMQQATVLIRQGWMPDPNMPIEVFGHAGTMQIHLIPGTPAQEFLNAAAVTTAEAAEVEQAQFRKAVEAEAKRQIAQAAEAELAVKRAAVVAEHQAAMRQLEAQIGAVSK